MPIFINTIIYKNNIKVIHYYYIDNNDNKWGCSPTNLGCLAVIHEIRNQTKCITIATHFVLHQLNWIRSWTIVR